MNVIIAPTIAFSKKQAGASIVDAVNPDTYDNVIIKEKIVRMTPQRPANVSHQVQNKRVENLGAIRAFVTHLEEMNRQRLEYEIITENKNMTYFPDVGILQGKNTMKIIGGTLEEQYF